MKPTTDPSHGLLACLADGSRFRLVSALTVGGRCVTELARDVGLSQSCTTRHLQALKQAGVVSAERQGKRVVYGLRADEPRVSSLLSWALDASTAEQPSMVRDESRSGRSTVKARRATSPASTPAPTSKPTSKPASARKPASTRALASARKPASAPTPAAEPNLSAEPTLAAEPTLSAKPSPAAVRTPAPDPAAPATESGAPPESRPQAYRPARSGDIEDFLL